MVFVACWFFATGIIIASFLPKDRLFFGLYYFIVAVIFLATAAIFWKKKKNRAIFIWMAFLFLGIWRLAINLPEDAPDKIWHYNENKVEFIGFISAEPVNRGKSQKLEIESLAINNFLLESGEPPLAGQGALTAVGGKILVSASPYPRFNYGDILRITCKLKRPEKIEDFDYEKYLAAKGIYSTCSFPKVSVLKESDLSAPILAKVKSFRRFSWLWAGIYKVRRILSAPVDNGVPEPESGLLKAFLFNDQTVPEDLNLSFRQSGLSHIVAISGSHISEIIGLAFFCLLFLGLNRRHAFWFCVPIIIFYVTMVGAPASAARSGIMGFLVLLAMYLGRLSRLEYTLALSGVVMLFFNPMLVIADAGFQLSFLAVLGMIYLYPVFDKWLARVYEERESAITTHPVRPGRTPLQGGEYTYRFLRGIRKVVCQGLALTIAAQVFTAPILIFGFRQISLVAPLANILVLWAAPLIMVSAFIAMALTFLIPAGAIIFFLPATFLAKYLIFIAEICAKLPLAYWEIGI